MPDFFESFAEFIRRSFSEDRTGTAIANYFKNKIVCEGLDFLIIKKGSRDKK
jgi:hypothetical protein